MANTKIFVDIYEALRVFSQSDYILNHFSNLKGGDVHAKSSAAETD